MSYKEKYFKYKNKYINLKNILGGDNNTDLPCDKIIEYVANNINSINATRWNDLKNIQKLFDNFINIKTDNQLENKLKTYNNNFSNSISNICDKQNWNFFYNKCRLLNLYKKYISTNLSEDFICSINTLNDILIATIPNNDMENRSDDVNTLINFGANINYIPDKAFDDKDITNITIPNCIEIIGYLSFANNQLTNISLPNSIIFIDYGAFISNSLINLEIPQSVSIIQLKAFEDNPLTNVTLPYLFKHDVSAIFDNENIKFNFVNNISDSYHMKVRVNYNNSIVRVKQEINSIIYNKEFYNFNIVNSLCIPEGVINIYNDAFAYNKITNITLPSSLLYIGNGAFANNQLSTVDIPEQVKIIGGASFMNNNIIAVKIPNSVLEINNHAFHNNKLTSVILPNSINRIKTGVFDNNNLTEINIPDNITIICRDAFANNKLTNIIIPNTVQLIEHGSFFKNPIKTITMPRKFEKKIKQFFNNPTSIQFTFT